MLSRYIVMIAELLMCSHWVESLSRARICETNHQGEEAGIMHERFVVCDLRKSACRSVTFLHRCAFVARFLCLVLCGFQISRAFLCWHETCSFARYNSKQKCNLDEQTQVDLFFKNGGKCTISHVQIKIALCLLTPSALACCPRSFFAGDWVHSMHLSACNWDKSTKAAQINTNV